MCYAETRKYTKFVNFNFLKGKKTMSSSYFSNIEAAVYKCHLEEPIWKFQKIYYFCKVYFISRIFNPHQHLIMCKWYPTWYPSYIISNPQIQQKNKKSKRSTAFTYSSKLYLEFICCMELSFNFRFLLIPFLFPQQYTISVNFIGPPNAV